MVTLTLQRTVRTPDAGVSPTGDMRTGNISLSLLASQARSLRAWVTSSATLGRMFCRGTSAASATRTPVKTPNSVCQSLACHLQNAIVRKTCADRKTCSLICLRRLGNLRRRRSQASPPNSISQIGICPLAVGRGGPDFSQFSVCSRVAIPGVLSPTRK